MFCNLFHCLVIFVHIFGITELSLIQIQRDSKGFVAKHLLHIMSVHKGHNLEPVEEPRHWLKYGGLGLARSQTLWFCWVLPVSPAPGRQLTSADQTVCRWLKLIFILPNKRVYLLYNKCIVSLSAEFYKNDIQKTMPSSVTSWEDLTWSAPCLMQLFSKKKSDDILWLVFFYWNNCTKCI